MVFVLFDVIKFELFCVFMIFESCVNDVFSWFVVFDSWFIVKVVFKVKEVMIVGFFLSYEERFG